jgi:excisionase family DNA binding protein
MLSGANAFEFSNIERMNIGAHQPGVWDVTTLHALLLREITIRHGQAEVTGLSLRFLYYAIQHKDLPTVRVGRCRLITEKALREWLERKTEASVQSRAEGASR